ncbi:MAG TPA: GNAT family N-acetyltransferase, partial [Allosphingosinicella sp.]|nr:GNAT family N-acetyltransferase [Allosphingosinicella sp.]
ARGELVACYVLPEAARRGVGARLVRALERIARREGAGQLTLSASLNAEPFYRALGYRPLAPSTHRLATGRAMPCIAMAKDLRGGAGRGEDE